jgi:hypothetical protein
LDEPDRRSPSTGRLGVGKQSAELNRVSRRIVRIRVTRTPGLVLRRLIEFDSALGQTIVFRIDVGYRKRHLQLFGMIHALIGQENDCVTEIFASEGDRADVVARPDNL